MSHCAYAPGRRGVQLEKSMLRSLAGVQLPTTYSAMCCECGDTVKHSLDEAKALECRNGPSIAPTIAKAAITPKEYPADAKGSLEEIRARRPGACAPSSRTTIVPRRPWIMRQFHWRCFRGSGMHKHLRFRNHLAAPCNVRRFMGGVPMADDLRNRGGRSTTGAHLLAI